jgi:zinc D-Ala-D-Ala carboxypeptidase
MQLTANFTLAEFTASNTAIRHDIDNTPPPRIMQNIRLILAPAMEEVRGLLDAPCRISSGYRSPRLNKLVRGSPSSQHMDGLAADFTCARFGKPLEVARAIAASGIEFDQLINEFGAWVHISFAAPGATPRRELLSIGKGIKSIGLQAV